MLADEDPLLHNGLLHPLPNELPRWNGPMYPPSGSVAQGPSGLHNFSGQDAEMHEDNHEVLESHGAAIFPLVGTVLPHSEMFPPGFGPATHAVIKEAPVKVSPPQLPPDGLKVDEDSESEDYDVMEITGPIPKSSRKRRARHMREPLEDIFVRRSRRLNPGLHGFRIVGTPQAAEANPTIHPTMDTSHVIPVPTA